MNLGIWSVLILVANVVSTLVVAASRSDPVWLHVDTFLLGEALSVLVILPLWHLCVEDVPSPAYAFRCRPRWMRPVGILAFYPVALAWGIVWILRNAASLCAGAWRRIAQRLSDRRNPNFKKIALLSQKIYALRADDVGPEAIRQAEETLALLRERPKPEADGRAAVARRRREARVTEARDVLLSIAADAEASSDDRLRESARQAAGCLAKPPTTHQT